MIKGMVLYKKSSGTKLLYSSTKDNVIYGVVQEVSGKTYPEKSVQAIISKGYWDAVYLTNDDVEKHEQHDQQSHGNWAGSGQGSVASSKAKQFFDNGGTISNKLDRLGEPSVELTNAQNQMKEMSDKLGFEWSIDSGVLQTANALGVIKYGAVGLGGESERWFFSRCYFF